MIYSHQDLQIKRNLFSVKVRDKWSHKRRHNLLMTLHNIGYMHCLTHWSGRCWKFKIENFSKSDLFWCQNVPHVLTKKMTTHTWCFCSQIWKLQAFELSKWAALSEWKSQRWSKKTLQLKYRLISITSDWYHIISLVTDITFICFWYALISLLSIK